MEEKSLVLKKSSLEVQIAKEAEDFVKHDMMISSEAVALALDDKKGKLGFKALNWERALSGSPGVFSKASENLKSIYYPQNQMGTQVGVTLVLGGFDPKKVG